MTLNEYIEKLQTLATTHNCGHLPVVMGNELGDPYYHEVRYTPTEPTEEDYGDATTTQWSYKKGLVVVL